MNDCVKVGRSERGKRERAQWHHPNEVKSGEDGDREKKGVNEGIEKEGESETKREGERLREQESGNVLMM